MNENNTQVAKNEASRHEEVPALVPPVDVIEDSSGITLYADLPGVPKDKLHLSVNGDTLNIEAEIVLPLVESLESSHAEVSVPRYRRAFTLSRELNPDNVSAELTNGVLKLRIPKAEHALPRKVQVAIA